MTEPYPQHLHPEDTLLFEYLDGELAAAEIRGLEAHLATCANCAARLDKQRLLFARIAQLPDEAPSRDLAPLVRARLSYRRPLLILAVLAQAATAALVIAFSNLTVGWQSLSPYLPVPVDPQVHLEGAIQALQGWMSGFTAWVSSWDLLNPAQTLHFDLPQTTALELGTLLLTATLFWLAGNGLLIASIKNKPPRRTL